MRSILCLVASVIALALGALPLQALAQDPFQSHANALQSKLRELQPQLRSSAFDQPIVLNTSEGADYLGSDLYAEMELPFAQVSEALRSPGAVCEWLILNVSVHSCEPMRVDGRQSVTLAAATRSRFAPRTLYSISYNMQVEASEDAFLRVALSAAQGPLATRDFSIVFEAKPIDASRTFVHLGYSFKFGNLAKLTMQAYLATVGRNKVGFSVIGRDAEGEPVHLRGPRASMERNLMRNYLALLAHASIKLEKGSDPFYVDPFYVSRLRAWFGLTERYSRQLHEMDLDEYLDVKREDLARAGKGGKGV